LKMDMSRQCIGFYMTWSPVVSLLGAIFKQIELRFN
jgi:hypothetical protein